MSREKKAEVIQSLQQLLEKCTVGILTDYRGLPAKEMESLRRTLRGSGVDYRVVKNTMARFAAKGAGREELAGLFSGPVAVAFGYGDITESTRLLADYIQSSKINLTITGGFMEGRRLTAEDVMAISKLPTKDVLLAKVVGGLASPIYNLAGCLAAPMRGMLGVLQARIAQLEGG